MMTYRTGKKYVRTSTSVPTGQKVNVTYGTGFFTGVECLSSSALNSSIHKLIWPQSLDYDTVSLADNFVITKQSIGDALQFKDFNGVDGIIGFGPVDLTQGTQIPDTNALVPTIMDNSLKQGLIKNQILGISFAPATSSNDKSTHPSHLTFI